MTRTDGWESRLAAYIEDHRHKPFDWVANNCVTFVNGAGTTQTGVGFCSDLCTGYSTTREAIIFFNNKMLSGGYGAAVDIVDNRLSRCNGYPSRGDIVARKVDGDCTGYSLGVCIGSKVAFVSAIGLQFAQIEPDDIAWTIE